MHRSVGLIQHIDCFYLFNWFKLVVCLFTNYLKKMYIDKFLLFFKKFHKPFFVSINLGNNIILKCCLP